MTNKNIDLFQRSPIEMIDIFYITKFKEKFIMTKLSIYAGHGGSDSGAVYGGRREKDYTLSISNGVSAILRGAGFEIINNRTTDTNRDINNDAKLCK